MIRVGNCEIFNVHGFFEGARTNGQEKELLHGELLYGRVTMRINNLSAVDLTLDML